VIVGALVAPTITTLSNQKKLWLFRKGLYMPDADMDDIVLAQMAGTGDADAFGKLYMHHLDAIYRYIYFRVENNCDAEDLTEQVFLKAWEALPNYRYKGLPFKSWLYRIAHNAVIDYQRRKKFTAPMPPTEEVYQLTEAVNSLETIIAAEEGETLAKAITQLPAAQQDVIILRFIEGLSHDQIASIIQKSSGACRVIQYRALAALEQLLSNERAGVQ